MIDFFEKQWQDKAIAKTTEERKQVKGQKESAMANAVLDMVHYGRLDLASMIKETRLPEECAAVYERLASDHAFPTVLQFDFTKEKDE